jgi:antitoxin CcdA
MSAKARTNVSLDAALLEQARALDINLSATLEGRLRELVAERRRRRWLEENRAALDDANAFVASHGLWSDGLRQF